MALFVQYEIVVQYNPKFFDDRFQPGRDKRVEHEENVVPRLDMLVNDFDLTFHEWCLRACHNQYCATLELCIPLCKTDLFNHVIHRLEAISQFGHSMTFV